MEKSPDLIEHSIYEKIVLVASAISPKLGMVLQQMSLFCRYGLHQANHKKLYVCFVIASQCRCELEYTLSSPSSKYTRSMSVTHKPTA